MKKSFTLIELLVSMGIIVMVIMSAMAIYIQVIGTRQKSLGQLNIQEDGQYIMSLIVKDIRAGMVDYSAYTGVEGKCVTITGAADPTSQLCLLDFSSPQNQIRYKTDLNDSGDCSQPRCELKKCEGSDVTNACKTDTGSYQTITMTNTSIERLDFYINPDEDPFDPGSSLYQHPRVTVVLKLKSLTEKIGSAPLVLQQTVIQRYGLKR